MDGPLVVEVLPAFAKELEEALRRDGDADLADQVAELRIWSRCGCDDHFCGSFYTGPEPHGKWSDHGEWGNVTPSVKGMVILDVVDRRIRFVEVISDSKVRTALNEWRPRLPSSD